MPEMNSTTEVPVAGATHSPGPWSFEAIPAEAFTDADLNLNPESRFWIVDGEEPTEVIATVESTARGDAAANARLIATATFGLALAEAIVEYFGEEELHPLLTTDIALRGMARVIVAKAAGQ